MMPALESAYDLAVIGAGPAGCASAWSAARAGLRVALFERGAYPRDKVCGEFLSPQSRRLLDRMLPGLLHSAPAIQGARFVAPSGRAGEFRLPAPAAGLSRRRLDAALWQAAGDAGVQCFDRAGVVALQRSPDDAASWHLRIAGRTELSSARRVIVAAGRWWRLAGLPGPAAPAAPPATWAGVKAHFRGLAPSPVVEMYCFPGGYCGLAPIEDGSTNACCLVEARHLAAGGPADFADWIARVSAHPALAARLRAGSQASATVVTTPVHLGRRQATLDDVLLAGDAAGFIDPFAGDGIARALLGGGLAAAAVLGRQEAAVHDYERRLRDAAGRSFLVAAALRRFVRAPGSIQAAAIAVLAGGRLGPAFVRATRFAAS